MRLVSTKTKQIIVILAWILCAPSCIIVSYLHFPSIEVEWGSAILMLVVMSITMLLPIKLRTTTISLERWITFTIFLQYGVFAELVFTQIAMIILLFSKKTETPYVHRFFINSLMFALVSVISGAIFHAVGGEIGSVDFISVCLFGLLYASGYTIFNSVLIQLYLYLRDGSYSLREDYIAWDFIVTILLLPFSISLYFLHDYFGVKALYLIGIPFILVLVIAIKYRHSDDLNDKLSSATVIGHELASTLKYDEVINLFLISLKDVVPFNNAYVIVNRLHQQEPTIIGYEDGDITKNITKLSFNSDENIDCGNDFKASAIFPTRKEVGTLDSFIFSRSVECVMTAPILYNQQEKGFLILTSSKINLFQPLEMKIVNILTGYLGTSLTKALYYENTVEQSETCGLTKLYNFRFLNRKLEEIMRRFHLDVVQSVSIIIIDIDYFKSFNDSYGHQSGNDILCKLAELLTTFSNHEITISRYGGEEFVIVLENYNKFEATNLSELIRKEVEQTSFSIVPDLSEDRDLIEVFLTISAGVATVPDDAIDAKTLMRNADRALYIGGKQAGRNRVGVYGNEIVERV